MDAFLLLAVAAEIRGRLLGGVVRGSYAAGGSGLWLELGTPRGPGSLLLSAETPCPRLAPDVPRPPRSRQLPPLAAVARQLLPGSRLVAVRQRGLDRTVCLEFEPAAAGGGGEAACGGRLILEPFGGRPNLLLTDAAGRILEAARHLPGGGRPQGPGLAYSPPPAAARPDPALAESAEAIAARLEPLLAGGLPPEQALRQGLHGIGELWAREIPLLAGESSAPALARALRGLLARLAAGPWVPHTLLDPAGEPVAALPLPLRHLPAERQRPAASLGAAQQEVAERLAGRGAQEAHRTLLRRLLQRLAERLCTRRTKLEAEAAEFARAERYQRMGEALAAHQAAVPRGAAEALLPDYAGGPGATLTVPLDSTLSAAANVERLFRAARRGRRGSQRVAARLEQTGGELAAVTALAGRLEAEGAAALAEIRRELLALPRLVGPRERAALPPEEAEPAPAARRPAPPRPGPAAPRRKGEGPEPRRFVSSEGLPILVGRDNQGNDYLTLHLARSEDLWLHVEGFSGSHVVVRMQGRTGGVPRQTLVEAAKLAAYYSQARSHGKVSVSYTLKKYVRKPRKSPAGLVTLTHEKTIVVKPDKELVERLAAGRDDGP